MSHRNDTVYDPARQCAGKRAYSSRAKARKYARRVQLRVGTLFDYRCPHCGFIHLGRRP